MLTVVQYVLSTATGGVCVCLSVRNTQTD